MFWLQYENKNSDGRQFHQYQKNEQSPLISTEHKKDHDIWHLLIIKYLCGMCSNGPFPVGPLSLILDFHPAVGCNNLLGSLLTSTSTYVREKQ